MSQRFIPAVFYRGGSSKGVFFHARDLPRGRAEIEPILLSVLGSPDPNGRQLNGMGGGISSLSKAVIITPSQHPDADVDYTFVQVAVDEPVCEWGGVCGNLSSAVGPFAVEEGLVTAGDGPTTVRIHETSTGKIIHSHFQSVDGRPAVKGDFAIAGVTGTGDLIRLDYLDPAGAITGKLLPTGNVIDVIEMPDGSRVEASMVDSSNACVFIEAAAVRLDGTESPDAIEARGDVMARLDAIRRQAGVMMGLGPAPEALGMFNPRIAVVSAPAAFTSLDGARHEAGSHDIATRMLSMGRPHRAVPLASALCLGVAAKIEGTLPHRLSTAMGEEVRVGNPSGIISVGAKVRREGDAWIAESAASFRTARRLMQGEVAVD
ncbi:PrpF family protein [Paracoccus sp. S-4012]|uniref:2-methylaconitate cis-trans isomerase PrpF family protein n=1 Tax=Paracoccus sp. S-4012 TaxID=2665648 RepID=UPI0012B02482|nr:PrpF domain-containing protein [Paracoccus sp. S-4012]MRX48942.1 PrpF family protein [Paracoccus sp. S-4012]